MISDKDLSVMYSDVQRILELHHSNRWFYGSPKALLVWEEQKDYLDRIHSILAREEGKKILNDMFGGQNES